MAAPSPVELAGDLVVCSITLDGRPIDPACGLVSLEVWRAVGRRPRARLVFQDGDPDAGTFPVSERGDLAPGVAITVSLGYGATATEVFAGLIRGQGLRSGNGEPPLLIVEATDRRTGVAVDGGAAADPVLTLTWAESIIELDLQMDGARRTPGAGIPGRVRFQGNALPAPGGRVTLAGLGRRFNGQASVLGVRHQVAEGQWTTELDIEAEGIAGARPHHVGRLWVEAATKDQAGARDIGERLDRLAGGALAAVLERVFDGLELSEKVVRLDRLDLDLGTVRPDRLEEDVMAAMARTLPGALKQALAGRQALEP